MLSKLRRGVDVDLWRYQFSGLARRFYQNRACPACGSSHAKQVDWKGVHQLYECDSCFLLYRFPGEDAIELDAFYQDDYAEPGITTQLPSDQELAALINTNFAGSAKDFSYHVEIFDALGLKPGMSMLDYGANWGYASYQFRQAGFAVEAFELSRKRAAFGKQLGLTIETDARKLKGAYDVVYSCHVLEHVPNPRAILLQQMCWLKPGGLLVAHTPNGSANYRKTSPKEFGKHWGRVHPVLLTDKFVSEVFGEQPRYVSSDDRPETVRKWNGQESQIHQCEKAGLFFAIRKPLNDRAHVPT